MTFFKKGEKIEITFFFEKKFFLFEISSINEIYMKFFMVNFFILKFIIPIK